MHPAEVLLIPLGRLFRSRRAGESASISRAPGFSTSRRVELTSSSFGDGETIPAKHCGLLIGESISPALAWGQLPEATKDLLVVMEDLDSPGISPRIHMVAAFPEIGRGLAEGALAPGAPGVRFLPGKRGTGRYAGPRPLPGHGTHHYRFHLYALDAPVDLSAVGDVDHLSAAVDGHVLASGMLTGTRAS